MAELAERHTIYWIPALAVFAAEGCWCIGNTLSPRARLNCAVLSLVLVGVCVQTWLQRSGDVSGYQEAAVYVVEHNDETPVCLFDGFLNGDFIYQVRRNDPERRLCVLRGDKVFYSMLSDPQAGYEEYVKTQDEVLDLIHRYDPELIVVEEPQIYFDLPAARLLRQTLRDHPDRFQLVKRVPIESNHPTFQGKQLIVYRSRIRNPNRVNMLELKVLGLRRSIQKALK
jgi:hypothetical protein